MVHFEVTNNVLRLCNVAYKKQKVCIKRQCAFEIEFLEHLMEQILKSLLLGVCTKYLTALKSLFQLLKIVSKMPCVDYEK